MTLPAWLTRCLGFIGVRASVGMRGERLAAAYLRKANYRILARNLRVHKAEIDILAIAPDGRTLVIAEVKTVEHAVAARPAVLRVDAHKQKMLTQAAVIVARKYRLQDRPLRFDVLTVELPSDGPAVVKHIPGAFESKF